MPATRSSDSAMYGAIIVGGGIQGLVAALTAAEQGLRPLVLERGELGAGASTASMGVLHGGLRYLQSLDIGRWYRSRQNQDWFAREFPEHCEPLLCRMPLYRGALRSPLLFRGAFLAERWLSRLAFSAPRPPALPSPPRVARGDHALPPQVTKRGLVGVAEWSELAISDAPALLAAMAARVEAMGGDIRQQEEATELAERPGGGLSLTTRARGRENSYAGSTVLICAGGGARSLAARWDRDLPLLSARVLAFNLLFDRPMEPGVALALSAAPGRGRSFFLRAHQGGTLTGTFYHPLPEDLGREPRPAVPQALIDRATAEIERAAPQLRGGRVIEVWAGALPDKTGRGVTLRNRDLIVDHAKHGGPRGLFTLLGTKLTTARSLALAALERIGPDAGLSDPPGLWMTTA
ncbi:NAD(P)/FAD-dependent oxidoreductase [Sphingomonas sp. CCH5-D11]|uniref:NAD(P)/FAD-dependent oxidoreductase n=1 Tax=Sphingomonas sp. CCH5-D11 TaxID=1768786 RepID=UPI0018D2371C|nr:FAD-dependent oxidoreductase [Sphingomonas sp. CCH5-D11]